MRWCSPVARLALPEISRVSRLANNVGNYFVTFANHHLSHLGQHVVSFQQWSCDKAVTAQFFDFELYSKLLFVDSAQAPMLVGVAHCAICCGELSLIDGLLVIPTQAVSESISILRSLHGVQIERQRSSTGSYPAMDVRYMNDHSASAHGSLTTGSRARLRHWPSVSEVVLRSTCSLPFFFCSPASSVHEHRSSQAPVPVG